MSDQQKTMAVVGAGVIGLSWARLARDHGWRVGITDPREDLDAVVEATFGADDPDVFASHTLAEVVAEADLVQENGPERLAVKHDLFGQFLESAPEHAVLATSSSSIGATLIADGLEASDRIVVGHPFNPPELMPLVEVVPGAHTSDSTLRTALELYRALGRAPIVIRREVPGFVANRLQVALTREALYLVAEGVVSVPDLDFALQNSLGLRWAATGLFEGNALGGGPEGARHLYKGLGAEVGKITPGTPPSDPQIVEQLLDAIDTAYGTGDENYHRLLTRRNERTRAILAALHQLDA
ncbi:MULTISPECIES: 3-hydroxyacyl-CoA dehydrogenase NAD-binding domain-containing protein [Mycobacteroides]|jgi:ketoreductase RED1|uniref:Hydroxylacyl-CoA dehydrogenase n=1 Tax=Mycobacteroides chelonae TaxID=1774 RepID=A0AB73M310_MYCCH|nr:MULTISPECIES: 3-hydroxyacyl-CoA dehydrogenase NAD-binding domain-containing protein [Mycobacteroides]KRQ30559.1 hydroxylacyl-CoA dehydrogenase [Mycobacteroides sp. H072]KRQ32088.1 hydroxylacyl-CoA dehydrogenase [Mycobacteroides sp. H002]KRQ45103.1 hydroxylacyl-CoA dehydrogenase [Mycobacteroides sp. H054]KRQ67364.1 hydroxylacyl-CoA dehydrogenase [Mycobacteroides sp. H001]MBF9329274.1 hydroxylacyl-CoA dehydrogenase [Mycobacteroides chelonae]